MAILEGGSPPCPDNMTGNLYAREMKLNKTIDLVHENKPVVDDKQSVALARIRALGSELRRFISAGKRGHKDEHNSVGL